MQQTIPANRTLLTGGHTSSAGRWKTPDFRMSSKKVSTGGGLRSQANVFLALEIAVLQVMLDPKVSWPK